MTGQPRALAEHDAVLDQAARADPRLVVNRDMRAEGDVRGDLDSVADVQAGPPVVGAETSPA